MSCTKKENSCHIIKRECKKLKITCGEKGKIVAGAISYGVCREQGRALSLLDISSNLQCEVSKLNRVYLIIRKDYWPEMNGPNFKVFAEKAIIGLIKGNGLTETPETEAFELGERTTELFHKANDMSIATGRNPYAIIAASIFIVLKSKDRYKSIDIKQISQSLKLTENTVRKRRKEIEDMLMQYARLLPWWNSQSKVLDVYKNLDEILKVSKFINNGNSPEVQESHNIEGHRKRKNVAHEDPTDSSKKQKSLTGSLNPPSYIASFQKSSILESKIKKAKHRLYNICSGMPSRPGFLEKFSNFDPSTCCEEEKCKYVAEREDLHIQSQLLSGISEEAIIQGFKGLATSTKSFVYRDYIRSGDEIKALQIINERM